MDEDPVDILSHLVLALVVSVVELLLLLLRVSLEAFSLDIDLDGLLSVGPAEVVAVLSEDRMEEEA